MGSKIQNTEKSMNTTSSLLLNKGTKNVSLSQSNKNIFKKDHVSKATISKLLLCTSNAAFYAQQ